MKTQIDPTKVRLSKHFMLSDFMGCNSVYSKGYFNRIYEEVDDSKLDEAEYLCKTILEPVLEMKGPLSISYGYLSPTLSRLTVKYQDPSKKSFHRWDLGAAADIIVHDHVTDGCEVNSSPIMLALDIDDSVNEYARMITYSESAGICVATSLGDNGNKRAFYENVYGGKPKVKPDFLRHQTDKARNKRYDELVAMGFRHPWQGEGYPTHHGGGQVQFHHIRISRYTMVSDYLYNRDKVSEGFANEPTAEAVINMGILGELYDWIVDNGNYLRVSIVKAYDREGHKYTSYLDGVSMDLIPPEGSSLEQLVEIIEDYTLGGPPTKLEAKIVGDRVRVWGDIVKPKRIRRRRV